MLPRPHLAAPLRLGGQNSGLRVKQTVARLRRLDEDWQTTRLKAFGRRHYARQQPQPFDAQQLQAIRNEASAALQAAVDKMQLRKWAVEQAFAVVASLKAVIERPTPTEPGPVPTTINDPMALAEAVYAFVSQAAVVKVDINPDKPF